MIGRYATRAGFFVVTRYTPISESYTRGIEFELSFHPGMAARDCTVGFVQVCTPVKKNKQGLWELFVQMGKPNQKLLYGNSYIDAGGDINPLFGMSHDSKESLYSIEKAVSKTSKGGQGRLGKCSLDQVTPVYMRDHPQRTFTGEEYKHEFETAAICLTAPLKGTCLGAIKWGYHVDAEGAVTPVQITVSGSYSADFKSAVETAWNNSQPVKIPTL